jgi:iron complex transport system ATP-binding protein
MHALLDLENIAVRVNNRELFRLDHVALKNGVFALVGRNGSGKSTFLRTLLGEHALYTGKIELNGSELKLISKSERAKLISVVYSKPGVFGQHTVDEVLLLGRLPYQALFAKPSDHDRTAVEHVKVMLEIGTFSDRPFNSLSDGEKQLVMIGRALVQDTPVLVLDEPGAFLDLVNRHRLSALLKKIAADTGKLIIYSTHHIDLLEQECDGVLLISDGRMRQLSDRTAFVPEIKKTFGLA